MKRRSFFKTTALGSTALAFSGVSSCTGQKPDSYLGTANPAEFELNEITVSELQKKMTARELTSESICKKYLDRIQAVDPMLKAVIELNPDALDIARALDEERKSGTIRGPLHGIPIMIKDNIDTGRQNDDHRRITCAFRTFCGC
jgi:amidase